VALLRLSDFPTGWTSKPHEEEENKSHPQIEQKLASCLGLSLSSLHLQERSPARVHSPDFHAPPSEPQGESTISNTVTYLPSTAEATARFGIFVAPKTPACLSTAMSEAIDYHFRHPSNPSNKLPSEVKLGEATLAQMSFPSFGDQSAAFRLSLPFTYKGLEPTVYFDIVALHKGRAIASLTFENVGTPADVATEEKLTALTARPMRATQ
jgi:hypothetical protein